MFMAKGEIKNIISLTKSKLASSKKSRRWSIVIIVFITLANILINIISTTQHNAVAETIKLGDQSGLYFLGIAIGVMIYFAFYKKNNDIYSVFPQTNNTRFISSQLSIYIVMIYLSIVVLGLYLVKYTIFKVLSLINSNIIIAFDFNLGYLITGFFVYLIYTFLLISFISFIATLILKFNAYAIIALLAICMVYFEYQGGLINGISNFLGFFIHENSLSIFFVKALITWIILSTLSLIINKYTSYYKSNNKYNNSTVIIVGIIVVIVISIAKEVIIDNPSDGLDEPYSEHEEEHFYNEDHHWKPNEIILDVSNYEDSSKIQIETNLKNEDRMHLDNTSRTIELNKANEIVIYYNFPLYSINNHNIIEYTEPTLDVVLEDNILKINYSYKENIKVVFISPWSVMRQFDIYKDKNFDFSTPLLYTTVTNGSGSVYISIE